MKLKIKVYKRLIIKKLIRFKNKIVGKPNYQQKYYHYLLETRGKLTLKKKKEILTEIFERKVGYTPNWDNPQTFNEKILWYKLYYQNPLITRCCDKFMVKNYVDEVLGDGHSVPTIDWWTHPDDVDFDALPNQFALKVNWSSGFNIIVKDKSEIDIDAIRNQLRDWIKPHKNSYYQMFNWGYKSMSPVIYAEEYISQVDDNDQVFDYKFFCYDGICKNIFITTDRFTKKTYNWFDRDFNPLPFTYGTAGTTPGGVRKPKHYEQMIEYAEKLAKPFPFVRVDFYEVGNRIMVGEMTFYSGGGILKFTPEEWDKKLGGLIKLPDPLMYNRRVDFAVATPREAYLFEEKITTDVKKHYCEQKAFSQLSYFPNLSSPTTYNEKLIWLALYYKNPLIAKCTDKYEFKKYIANKIGEEYVVPLIGVYEDLNTIDFDNLPNQFVMKSTAGWGNQQVMLIHDKKTTSWDVIKAKTSNWLMPWNTYYYNNMCITDEKIKPRIIIEEMIEESGVAPVDYKFYCANGKPIFVLLVSGRSSEEQRRTFLDIETREVMSFRRRGVHKSSSVEIPEKFDEMIELARKLSKNIPFIRVDFYESNGRVYAGEMTFSPGLFLKIEPIEWDYKLGALINLPQLEAEDKSIEV